MFPTTTDIATYVQHAHLVAVHVDVTHPSELLEVLRVLADRR